MMGVDKIRYDREDRERSYLIKALEFGRMESHFHSLMMFISVTEDKYRFPLLGLGTKLLYLSFGIRANSWSLLLRLKQRYDERRDVILQLKGRAE